MGSGFFVTVEGLDGSGKSTQVSLLSEALRADGQLVTVVRDPGTTELGERVRRLLLNPGIGAPVNRWAETCLFLAARAQLFHQVIQPALELGHTVLSDRYLDSTLAYQGARGISWEPLLELHRLCGLDRFPDLTLYLDIPVDRAQRRRSATIPDRLEAEAVPYHETVRSGYLELARRFPARVTVVPAEGRAEELAGEIRALVWERMAEGRAI